MKHRLNTGRYSSASGPASMNVESLLKEMVLRNASDLHLRVGGQPAFRINGELYRLQNERIVPEQMEQFILDLMDRNQKSAFDENHELDFAIGIRNIGRFRVNAFKQRGTSALAIRAIVGIVPAFEQLGLPEVIRDLSLRKRGLILVTGTTGSGKSTTLASMIDHINEHTSSNIVTIEDPIEFLYKDKKSIISQREVSSDTTGFTTALRSAFRQDPDVILVGEIRDQETMSIGLTAADTGHLVLSTLHTMNAVETINRIVSFFPPHQHQQVRLMLSSTLVAIITLRLLARKDGKGRVPACEIMVNNATVRELLTQPENTHMIDTSIREGYTQYGSQSFDQSILRLYQDDLISYETALRAASNPDDFELKVRGVEGSSDRSWMSGV
jgi:twitching motility protein PilT